MCHASAQGDDRAADPLVRGVRSAKGGELRGEGAHGSEGGRFQGGTAGEIHG